MENIGYIFGLVALVLYVTLSSKVSRLERMIKEAGIGAQKKASLGEVLEKNIGRDGVIVFESGEADGDIGNKPCHILDVDEDWLLVKTEKKGIIKLIRIDSVKTIQFS